MGWTGRRDETVAKPLFRKEALERLNSPDRLDSLLTVTTPRGWIALTAAALLLAAALAWSVFGSVPVRIPAHCILLRPTAVTYVVSSVAGQIVDIRPAVGDEVRRGDVVARVARPDLVDRILALEAEAAEADEPTRRAIRGEIDHLRQRLDMESRIVSPYNGRVLRRNVQLFDVVGPGSPVISIEQTGDSEPDLEAVLYVSAEERHLIAPGMDVSISPVNAPKERYGLLSADVVSVAPLPSSIDDIAALVGSRELAVQLAGEGAPVEVRAVLVADRSTPSGYRWSSRQGPPFPLVSGTVCTASITVSQRRPLGLIIPGL